VTHPNGYVEVKDRAKDIIVSGGENISTVEVEAALFRHPWKVCGLARVRTSAREVFGSNSPESFCFSSHVTVNVTTISKRTRWPVRCHLTSGTIITCVNRGHPRPSPAAPCSDPVPVPPGARGRRGGLAGREVGRDANGLRRAEGRRCLGVRSRGAPHRSALGRGRSCGPELGRFQCNHMSILTGM
jgi:hypothetical protein